MAGYPIMLEVSQRQVVIVGGGKVAARKAAGLLAAGAGEVTMVAPAFCDAVPAGVRRVQEAYRPQHIANAEVVFAATDDPAVNSAVVRDAQERGLLVNRADGETEPEGDFTVPAVHRDGPITIAVAAGGNPAIAAAVRDRVARDLDRRWAGLSEAMLELRGMILSADLPPRQREQVLKALATDEALQVLSDSGRAGLWEWTLQLLNTMTAK